MLKKEMQDNQKLNGLQGKIGEMHNDFEDMKRTREEARKQLEAKFQDIYKKIAALKEALDTEAKRVNNALKAFESKFIALLTELKEQVNKNIEEEKKFVRDKFDSHEKRMNDLEQMIKEEREERLKQSDEMLIPLIKRLDALEEGAKQEKVDRLEGEKEIIRNINDNVYEINERIKRETEERGIKEKIMNENMMKEFEKRDKYFADFQNQSKDDLKVLKDEIYFEMENRFAHQNRIIDNISNFLKTFQDTLKIMGKEP